MDHIDDTPTLIFQTLCLMVFLSRSVWICFCFFAGRAAFGLSTPLANLEVCFIDGTIIEDDDVLEFMPHGEILVLNTKSKPIEGNNCCLLPYVISSIRESFANDIWVPSSSDKQSN